MNAELDTYRSIAAPSTGSFRDLGSRFLSFAHPVWSEARAKEIISAVKKEYYDATHHCYAWRIGRSGEFWRANDDGEPSSTAGRPILGQLLSNDLSDVLIVVVRYFGGTKLGVPGLIRAYRSAAAAALDGARIVEKVSCETFTLEFDYLQMNDVMKALKELGISPAEQIFDLRCRMTVKVRLSLVEEFRSLVSFCRIY